MSDRLRVAAVTGCCVLAAFTPFIVGVVTAIGLVTAILGLVFLGCAIVLIARAAWSLPTRLLASIAAVAATSGLVIAQLILWTYTSGD